VHGCFSLRGGPEKGRPSLNYNKIRWLNKLGGKNSPEEKPAKMARSGSPATPESGGDQAAGWRWALTKTAIRSMAILIWSMAVA
jgi:hypothetical protein